MRHRQPSSFARPASRRSRSASTAVLSSTSSTVAISVTLSGHGEDLSRETSGQESLMDVMSGVMVSVGMVMCFASYAPCGGPSCSERLRQRCAAGARAPKHSEAEAHRGNQWLI